MTNFCTYALVAGFMAVGSGGLIAINHENPDIATRESYDGCAQVFAPDNADVRLLRKSRALRLVNACKVGVDKAHEAIYDSLNKDPRYVYPRLPGHPARLRLAYTKGFEGCAYVYGHSNQLRERLACLDGYDRLTGVLIARADEPGWDGFSTTGARFDRAYFKNQTFESVYQDIGDPRQWAQVMQDRVTTPRDYPAYRRDQMFAPPVAPDQVRNVDLALGIPDGSKRALDAWGRWYLYAEHFRTCPSCTYTPTPEAVDPPPTSRPSRAYEVVLSEWGPNTLAEAVAKRRAEARHVFDERRSLENAANARAVVDPLNSGSSAAALVAAMPQPTKPSAPTAILRPAPRHDFGVVATGASQDMVMTIKNGGASAASALSAQALAAPFFFKGGSFPGTGGTCAATLGANASCTVVLSFAPTTVGSTTGRIELGYADGVTNERSTLELIGTGATPSLLTLSDGATYDFGDTAVGSVRDHTFTISNTGGVAATALTAVKIDAPFSFKGGSYPGTGGTCGKALNAGTSCTVTVTYAPTTTGPHPASIFFAYTDGRTTQSSGRSVQGVGVTRATISFDTPTPPAPRSATTTPPSDLRNTQTPGARFPERHDWINRDAR